MSIEVSTKRISFSHFISVSIGSRLKHINQVSDDQACIGEYWLHIGLCFRHVL